MVWGTYPVQTPEAEHVAEIVDYACATVAAHGMAEPGGIIAIAAGMPFGVSGTTTNLLRIERLPGGPTWPPAVHLRWFGECSPKILLTGLRARLP